MSVFELDQSGEEKARQSAVENGISFNEVTPGFFEGVALGTGAGIARGFAKLGRAAALAGAAIPALAETSGLFEPGELTDPYFDKALGITDRSVEFFTPNANEVGTVGRVLGGLSEIIAPLALGGGNPIPLIASTGLNTSYDLAKQGVDPLTAVGVSAIDATAVGIGFRLPFLGSTFLKKAATGAGGSLALGIAATAADRAALDARGYEELAQQYNPLDIEARTVDLLTGIAFGGIAQLQSRSGRPSVETAAEPSPTERNAALAGLNAKHYQNDTAPGRPGDEAALVAHQDAIEQALRQLQQDAPVDVSQSRVTQARFIDAPREAPSARDPQSRAILEELGIRDEPVTREPARPPADESIVDTTEALGETPRSDVEPGRNVTPAETTVPAPDAPPAAREAQTESPARIEPSTERADIDDPDVTAAERSLEDSDIQIETGDLDADGGARTASARESLAAARAEVTAAAREATAFEAAVACALSFGDV